VKTAVPREKESQWSEGFVKEVDVKPSVKERGSYG